MLSACCARWLSAILGFALNRFRPVGDNYRAVATNLDDFDVDCCDDDDYDDFLMFINRLYKN